MNRNTNNFDFIRFVAAVFVIITHSITLAGKGDCDILCEISQGTMQLSHLGVAVFFTISGYLIVKSYLASKDAFSYLWRRIVRIIPALAVVLLFTVFLLGPLLTTLPLSEYFASKETYMVLRSVSLYRLYLHLPGVFETNPLKGVNGALWTLAYEFSCYLFVIFAGVIGLLNRRYVLVGIFFLGLLLRLYLGDRYFVYNYSTPYLLGLNILYVFEWGMYFLAGSLVYLFQKEVTINASWVVVLLIALVLSLLLSLEYGRLVWYLFIPVTIFSVAFVKCKLNDFSRWGDFSYGIYIIGFPVQQTIVYLTNREISPVQLFGLTMIVLVPLAALSWHLIEKRALRLKYLFEHNEGTKR